MSLYNSLNMLVSWDFPATLTIKKRLDEEENDNVLRSQQQ